MNFVIDARRKYPAIILSIISITSILAVSIYIRSSALPSEAELGVDAYYHVAMADQFPGPAIEKRFPRTQLSLWKDSFYNKELGFHAILSSIRKVELVCSKHLSPPFHFTSAFLLGGLLICLTLGACWRGSNLAYMIPILAITVSPLFFLRINMVRPHVLSIILFMSVLFIFFTRLSIKRRMLLLFILGVIYVYCYSSPHLLFIPVISFFSARIILGGTRRCRWRYFREGCMALLIAGVSLAAGLLFHPQFPNTFHLWYVQGVMVVKQILFNDAKVGLGLELLSPSFAIHIENFAVHILFLANLTLLFLLKRKNVLVTSLFILQAVMLCGFFLSERCLEYYVPAGILCLIFCVENKIAEKHKDLLRKPLVHAVVLITFLSLSLFCVSAWRKTLKSVSFPSCAPFGKWAAKHLPAKLYVGNLRWGEFPRLFHAAPHLYFSTALDPMFSYALYPEKIQKLEDFRQLKQALSPSELREIMGTNLVFVSKFDPVPTKHLIQMGAKVIYWGVDGTLLMLEFKDKIKTEPN